MNTDSLLSPADDTASKALVDTQSAITRVKEIITECVSKGVGENETTARLNKAIVGECKRIENGQLREQTRRALVAAARKWHYELKQTYRILDRNAQQKFQPLDIDINNLLRMTPFQRNVEFRKILDDGTSPGVPMIRDYQRSVKIALKAMSAEPPKVVTRKNGKTYVMPLRNRAEMAVRYDANVKGLQELIDKGYLWAWTSSHPNCSPRCKDYQGLLWSLFEGTVKVGDREYGESGTIDGINYEPIKTALLGPDGDGNGIISGYNCRHRLIGYRHGSRPPEDFTETEIKREYAIDKQQRSYENRIRQMKTEERQLRAAGLTQEAAELRKKWRRLNIDYEVYSLEHDRAFYRYRTAIDRNEIEIQKISQDGKMLEVPEFNKEVIGQPSYRDKFRDIPAKRQVISTVIRECRRSIVINDKTSNERGVIVDEKGKSAYTFSGKNSQASYDASKIETFPKNSLVLVHNHPHSGSFSADDILTLSDYPQIKTIVAAGHNGTVYSLTIGDGKRVDKTIYSEYNILKNNGLKTDEIVKTLSDKYGWRYNKS